MQTAVEEPQDGTINGLNEEAVDTQPERLGQLSVKLYHQHQRLHRTAVAAVEVTAAWRVRGHPLLITGQPRLETRPLRVMVSKLVTGVLQRLQEQPL